MFKNINQVGTYLVFKIQLYFFKQTYYNRLKRVIKTFDIRLIFSLMSRPSMGY